MSAVAVDVDVTASLSFKDDVVRWYARAFNPRVRTLRRTYEYYATVSMADGCLGEYLMPNAFCL